MADMNEANIPQVSVIIPIYNVEKYLPRCIDSVLTQSMQDFEIILVNDGSPDNCGKICDDYSLKDSRILVVHKENGGLSDARNAGLSVAKGKYIYFLDSDDYILPNLLETLLYEMKQSCDSASVTYVCSWDDGKTYHQHMEENTFLLVTGEEKYRFMLHKFMRYKVGHNATSRMYSRDRIEKLGLRFQENKRIYAEDLCFNLCYLADAHKIVSMDKPLYIYTIREDSITGAPRQRNKLKLMHTLAKEVECFWRERGYVDLVDNFAVFYYLIVAPHIDMITREAMEEGRNIREVVLGELAEEHIYIPYFKVLSRYRKDLIEYYGKEGALERLSFVKYLLDGNKMTYRFRNIINYRLKHFL